MATSEIGATSVPARSTRARVARVVGNVLLVLGVILLAWGFVIWRWGDPVTGLYTRWQQHRLEGSLTRLEQGFSQPPATVRLRPPAGSHRAPGPTPAELRSDARQSARRLAATVHPGDAVGRIRIPRLDLNMILIDGTDHSSLKRGPGVDRRTALPGEGQLVYIAGHRTTYGAPFAHIDAMRKGDLVELDMPYGKYVYRVTNWVIVPASDLSRLRSRGREEVALQACHPRFSARQRYIVYARSVSGPGISRLNSAGPGTTR